MNNRIPVAVVVALAMAMAVVAVGTAPAVAEEGDPPVEDEDVFILVGEEYAVSGENRGLGDPYARLEVNDTETPLEFSPGADEPWSTEIRGVDGNETTSIERFFVDHDDLGTIWQFQTEDENILTYEGDGDQVTAGDYAIETTDGEPIVANRDPYSDSEFLIDDVTIEDEITEGEDLEIEIDIENIDHDHEGWVAVDFDSCDPDNKTESIDPRDADEDPVTFSCPTDTGDEPGDGDHTVSDITITTAHDEVTESILIEPAGIYINEVDPDDPVPLGESFSADVTLEHLGQVDTPHYVFIQGADQASWSERVGYSIESDSTATIEVSSIPGTEHKQPDANATLLTNYDEHEFNFSVAYGEYAINIVDLTDPVQQGLDLEVQTRITNTGTANGTQDVVFAVDGETQQTEEDLELEADNHTDLTLSHPITENESDTVEFSIETDDERLSRTVDIIPPGPHIEVTDLEPASIEADTGWQFEIDATVENIGQEPGSTTVHLDVDSALQDETTVDLGANEADTVELVGDVPETEGNYSITVWTDDGEQQANLTATDMPANVSIAAVEPTEPVVEVGEDVALTVTLENTGPGFADEELSLQVGNDTIATSTVTVPGDETANMTLVGPAPEEAGNHSYLIESNDDERTGLLVVDSGGLLPTDVESLLNTAEDLPWDIIGGVAVIGLVLAILGYVVVGRGGDSPLAAISTVDLQTLLAQGQALPVMAMAAASTVTGGRIGGGSGGTSDTAPGGGGGGSIEVHNTGGEPAMTLIRCRTPEEVLFVEKAPLKPGDGQSLGPVPGEPFEVTVKVKEGPTEKRVFGNPGSINGVQIAVDGDDITIG